MNYTIQNIDQLKPILKGFRKLRNLTQQEVAQKLGISQQAYQVLEANPQNVTMERLFRVFVILDVKFDLIDKQDNTRADVAEGSGKYDMDMW
ncbi:hypothetical protein GCM10011365_15940 [Marinicella pacifica]|uniref:HTH cro/C1-type domain-containing protein n=1 Tax=Marinicella pacifica TaxID=1171543 RepID=A0A917CTA9_9GAMM|nr:helix-turn-helix transcriptional regulator [Marinicella pacifica]GGF95416.1 hypothetical protein GCM10011365_15940 [Marinicella pacifica]